MKCTIPGVQLKVFGRAIQSLSKIGDELYFEPLPDGLYLRSVNSCRSAYGCFQFAPNFFSNYVIDSRNNEEADDQAALRCKIGMKSVTAVFRNVAVIDKTVEKCRVSFNEQEARLVFQMYCRHGIIKTHKLAITECETLQAVFSKDLCPNKVSSNPKILCDAVLNFQNNQEEITVVARPDYLALKNYIEDETDATKIMHTELTLSPDEFDQYQVGVDSDVTFCLKEFRAILGFADITNLPLILQFDAAGRPITFSITSDLTFEANFVLATLADAENIQAPAPSKIAKEMGSKNSKTKNHPSTPVHSNGIHKRHTQAAPVPERHRGDDDEEMNDDDDAALMDLNISACESVLVHNPPRLTQGAKSVEPPPPFPSQLGGSKADDSRREQRTGQPQTTPSSSSMAAGSGETPRKQHLSSFKTMKNNKRLEVEDEMDCDSGLQVSHQSVNSTLKSSVPNHNVISSRDLSQRNSDTSRLTKVSKTKFGLDIPNVSGSSASPVIPNQDTSTSQPADPMSNHLTDEEKEDEEEIPVTPPSKKFRSVFFGTQSSTQSSCASQRKQAEILALDSDDGD